MRPEIFRKLNVAFILDNCGRCNILCQFIERINQKLRVEKEIKVINCTYFQKYGIPTNHLILLYSKHFDGYPCVFNGDIRVIGANSKIESYEQFKSLFEDDFVIPEQSEYKFLKDCEFNKSKGMLKNRIICN